MSATVRLVLVSTLVIALAHAQFMSFPSPKMHIEESTLGHAVSTLAGTDVPLYPLRVAYAVNISIGTPAQRFRVLFVRLAHRTVISFIYTLQKDTGSSTLIIPSTACGCQNIEFDPTASTSYSSMLCSDSSCRGGCMGNSASHFSNCHTDRRLTSVLYSMRILCGLRRWLTHLR